MKELLLRLLRVADRAIRDHSGMAVVQDRLDVVGGCYGGAGRVLRAVAGRAVHAALAAGFLEQLARLFVGKLGVQGLVALATGRFIVPGDARFVPDGRHPSMTIGAGDSCRDVNVALAFRLNARVTGVAGIGDLARD